MEGDYKSVFTSKTIIGAVVTIAASISLMFDFDIGDTNGLVEQISAVFGGVFAIYGPAEYPLMTPVYSWQYKSFISMGNRLHGGNLNTDWQTLYSRVPSYGTLVGMFWSDIVGWVWIHLAADNTCTNAAVQVYDYQIQIFNNSTNKWQLVSTVAAGRDFRASTWYDLPNAVSGGANDLIYAEFTSIFHR